MNELISQSDIQSKIYEVRGMKVMLDRDLAALYQVETKRLNEQVKRNKNRFPSDFMFQLSSDEFEDWKSQFATSNRDKMGLRRAPYAFTEQGVSMLSSILKSEVAVQVNIKIIRTFVEIRRLLASNNIESELRLIKNRLDQHDQKHKEIFAFIQSSINDNVTKLL